MQETVLNLSYINTWNGTNEQREIYILYANYLEMSFGYYNIISILIVKTAQPQHFKKCLLSIIFTMIHMQTSRKLFQTDKLADIEPTIWKPLIFSSLKKKGQP